jgi:hypothetical protein
MQQHTHAGRQVVPVASLRRHFILLWVAPHIQ